MMSLLIKPLLSLSPMDTQQLWQAVLGELELLMSRPHFITWFKDTFIADATQDQIIVGVPHVFTRNWLEKKFHDKITEIVKKHTKNPRMQVHYKIESSKNLLKKQLLNIVNEPLPHFNSGYGFPSESLPMASGALNPKYVFDTFVVGKGNELAHAACMAVSANPGTTYNPLFLYGGVGLGKTHLMQAIGNHILKIQPNAKILYASSETFTNDYIRAIKEGNANEFKNKYRTVDVLLVDDIQFLAGKDGTQEEFFHTFNELHQKNRQLVISSDRPPKAIHAIESRLMSRFEWGMIADIMNPDYETRMAILESKCKEKNYPLTPEILSYIANTIINNVRELEGALNKIIAYHQLNRAEPTIESVKTIVNTISANLQKQSITPKFIIETIAQFFDISQDDLTGSSREKRLVVPRQISMFLMREELKSSFPAIGQQLGGRDHTTAMHAYEKIKKQIRLDDQIRQNIELVKQKLYV